MVDQQNKMIQHKGKNQTKRTMMLRMKKKKMAQARTGAGTNHGGNPGIGITKIGGRVHGVGAHMKLPIPGHQKSWSCFHPLCRDGFCCRMQALRFMNGIL